MNRPTTKLAITYSILFLLLLMHTSCAPYDVDVSQTARFKTFIGSHYCSTTIIEVVPLDGNVTTLALFKTFDKPDKRALFLLPIGTKFTLTSVMENHDYEMGTTLVPTFEFRNNSKVYTANARYIFGVVVGNDYLRPNPSCIKLCE